VFAILTRWKPKGPDENAAKFLGIYGDGVKPEFPECIESFPPLQRMGTPDDVANVAEYLTDDLAAFVSGQHLLITGGAPA
jgi:3-oxoacyl-[acyl-carrier protein] reductase